MKQEVREKNSWLKGKRLLRLAEVRVPLAGLLW